MINNIDFKNNLNSFSSSIEYLCLLNSNFSQSNSNTITKQTNLSSITANELNINTKNNTHLKGSLIAAGYYKDNTKNSNNNLVFIDNKNLNLTTNTLTYENLSNTSYTKDSSLSVGLNYAIKESIVAKENKANDTKQINQIDNQANTTTKQTNQDINSKISSLNYSNNRNLSYNHSKTLATIGQGNLIVANTNISNLNKDELENLQSTNTNLSNSDNLTRLNRDTTKTNKDLYNTNISSNVDASVDMRMFNENGQNEIRKELEQIKKEINIIAFNIIYKDQFKEAKEVQGKFINKLVKLKETQPQKYNEVVNALNEYGKKLNNQDKLKIAPGLLAIPPILTWLTSYLNAPDVKEELKSGIPLENPALLAVGGGFVANVGTKTLSKIILGQEARTSIAAGFGGASIDAGFQIWGQIYDQMMDNGGYIDLSKVDLNYESILFSGVAGATTVPSMINSGKEIYQSGKAFVKKYNDFVNSRTINRKNKNLDGMLNHGGNIAKHLIFQEANKELENTVKSSILGNTNE
ncbi:hypothetical protein [Campylobacter sputorum]|uniref:hypothetical protein n=1 Tax=Campylobacter sputorum TaxID=206 RepID=UPI001912333F|nr:hypothetical protein [Campylobacter sputorum]ASM36869.1 hypothetical protein CSF_1001 [Campylobacter sputorum bv. faecalis CCUG 20703]